MKRILSCAVAVLLLATAALRAEELKGRWKSVSEEGDVEITADDGKLHKMVIAGNAKFYDEAGKSRFTFKYMRKLKSGNPVKVKYDVKNKVETITEVRVAPKSEKKDVK